MKQDVLIVAGEASSSLYAQRLLEYWQSHGRNVAAFGIGSRAMEQRGFKCLGRSEEMAVVGLQEVIKHLPLIRRVFNELLSETERRKPAFALLLDYPDFNLRLAKQLKKRGVKVIYYISPQVWAWRTSRVHSIRRVVDLMLVVFPFEVEFYKKHGVHVEFVGHPALDEIPSERRPEVRETQRQRFGLNKDDIVLGLMPGSRKSELAHCLETQLLTAKILCQRFPKVRPVLFVAPTLERENFQGAIANADLTVQIIKENPLEMIALADVILVASGTATLMVGLMETPMIIMYRMNAITAWFAKRLVTATKYFGMANLVLDKRAVPEFFQEQANPESLANELAALIENREKREQMISDLREIKSKLGSRGATERVAKFLDGFF